MNKNKGLIIKLVGGLYTVFDLNSKKTFEAIPKGLFRNAKIDKESKFQTKPTKRTKKEKIVTKLSPKVGDYCIYENISNRYIISELIPRKNEMIRPQVVNIDKTILVFSAVEPKFSFTLLDRYLIQSFKRNIVPTILITKIDLINKNDLNTLKNSLKYYETMGCEIIYINNLDETMKKDFKYLFENKITLLMGQTGVGKSSFLNYVDKTLDIKTNPISKALGRGVHTTRHSELYYINNGWVCDSPGFSSLDFDFFDPEELKNYYPDFNLLSSDCKFGKSCLHYKEPKCAIKKAVSQNKIIKSRYDNYIDFLNELENKKDIY